MFETSSLLADLLGYAAAAAVFLAFSLKSILSLRVVAILSNVLFIAYALTAQLMPVLLLHALLLPLNGVRLWQLLQTNRSDSLSRSACVLSQNRNVV